MVNKMRIRPETAADYNEIYSLVKVAFETAKVKDGDEQDYAVKLRSGAGYIPGLALVAEENNRLIGHIMLTKIHIDHEGHKQDALLLSPLSVLLEYRNKGVGSALVRDSLERAKKLGYKYIFLVGDPAYYSRFGFSSISGYAITQSLVPNEYALVLELQANALSGVSGSIELH